jgi:type IV secretion system protein VirB9
MKIKLLLTLFSVFVFAPSHSAEPQDSARDSRIKIMPFVENQVVEIEANRFIGTVIHFLPDEEIMQPVSLGDPNAWSVSGKSPRDLVISPIADSPNTNMTVRTTKRFYYFYLTASSNKGASASATQAIRFIDPTQDELDRRNGRFADSNGWAINSVPSDSRVVPAPIAHLYEPVTAEFWNFRYKFSSKNKIGLSQVFDNGVKTYFAFDDSAELPAIFVVRENGESLIQTAPTQNGYMSAFTTAKKWVLRRGSHKLIIEREGQ